MTSIYERMLQLPIFQGLSSEQLTGIVEKIPFSFMRFKPGAVIQQAGEPCDCVTFVLTGTVRMTTPTFGGRIRIVQDFAGPHTMPFYYLFGAETNYGSSLVAVDVVGVMQVRKKFFLTMLQMNHIMLVNVMNILSTHAQKQHLAMDLPCKDDVLMRLSSWMLAFTDRRATDIVFEADEEAWCQMMQTDPTVFWRNVTVLESRKCIDTEGTMLRLVDRYTLRQLIRAIEQKEN